MILKSFVLIEDNSSFLLIREAAKKWRGKWFLPGGKVNPGETPVEAAIREVKEEAGCDVQIEGLFYIRYQEGLFKKQLSLFYCAKLLNSTLKIRADRHSLEVKWLRYSEIRILPLRQKLTEILVSYNPQKIMPPENFRFYH